LRGRRFRDQRDALGELPFGVGEIIGAIHAEQRRDVRVGPVGQQLHLPSKPSRRETHGADRMSQIVLAVAEGALSVLPRLAPEDRGEPDEQALIVRRRLHPACNLACRGQKAPACEDAPLFECVLARRVVTHAAVPDDVGLGGMEITAGGIDPQGPAVGLILLPRGESHRTSEQLGDRPEVER